MAGGILLLGRWRKQQRGFFGTEAIFFERKWPFSLHNGCNTNLTV